MSTTEAVVIAVGVSVLVAVALEATRPKGARIFSRGPNGEDTLLWDPKSATKKA